MTEIKVSPTVLLSVLGMIIGFVEANIGEFDEVWQRRALEARNASLKAYHPNPYHIINQVNKKVHEATENYNSTSIRRELGKKYKGPCLATNPIDQCWRCRSDWATDRKRLADCAIGFGHKTTGGKDGPIYVVRDNSDCDLVSPKPGTLRHAVIQKGPLWITFACSMFIRLNEELIMTSDKTIDGRGANVHICDGAGIMLQFVNNVIIHSLHVHDISAGGGGMIRDSTDHFGWRTRSDGDGISIFGSTNVWVDHISMWRCQDGLIDAISGSTAITISNCHMTHHDDTMLFGASDSAKEDEIMQITVAFNHFGKGLVQRMPRCRYGFVHVVNNDYTHWLMYAMGGSMHPTIISQGNRFIAPPNPNAKEVTKRNFAPESEWKCWPWRSQGDLMMNGAFFVQSGDPHPDMPDHDVIPCKPGSEVTMLTKFAGSIKCVPNKPC